MGNDKGDCDRKMVKSLDLIPYGEMPKWGQTARFLIDKKQKLGLGVKSKNKKPSSEENWQEKLANEFHKPTEAWKGHLRCELIVDEKKNSRLNAR